MIPSKLYENIIAFIDGAFFFTAAGKAFMEAAKLHINLQSTHEAGQRYLDAGNCFKKTDTEGISGRFFFLLLVLETVKTM